MQVKLQFEPRDYQRPVLNYLLAGGKRAVCVWHRRAGKDLTAFNWTLVAALNRTGTYFCVYPSYTQGKKILWQGMDRDGRKFIDYIPEQLVKRRHETDMRIELTNGSAIQVIGSDNIDSIVGTNPVGVFFSEYSLSNPIGWDYIRPILAENKGWALFIYTPRGRNHGHELFHRNIDRPGWFVERLTVDDTNAISYDAIDEERQSGMPEELVQQEYWCDFSVTNVGSYFGAAMMRAADENRIIEVPYDPKYLVHTAWDVGYSDSTAIWFVQTDGFKIRLIDYFEAKERGSDYYKAVLDEKGYVYGLHLGPHDLGQHKWETGTSAQEIATGVGLHFEVLPRMNKIDQRQATHAILPRCWFDSMRCAQGIACLREYSREWDPKLMVFKQTPRHDWSSHGADAFQQLGIGINFLEGPEADGVGDRYYGGNFNPRDYADFDPRHSTTYGAEPVWRR